MKKIEKEVTAIIDVYQAVDGTEFESAEECKKYEDTAKCVLLSKYQSLVKKTRSEFEIFSTGNEDYMMDIIQLKHTSDIDTVLQLVALYSCRKTDNAYFDKNRTILAEALSNNDFIIIGRGYGDDDFYIHNTVSNILTHIQNVVHNETD